MLTIADVLRFKEDQAARASETALLALLSRTCEMIMAECPNAYGKSYANAWLQNRVQDRAIELGISPVEAAQTQALYILDNLRGWRGPSAKVVRQALKDVAGAKI